MKDHLRRALAGGWVETSIHLRIMETIGYAVSAGATTVITGRPGIGKSTSLRSIADDNSIYSVLIEYAPRFRTMKGLHKAFLEAFGRPDTFRSAYEMEEACESSALHLAQEGGYLMIDEFQNFDLEAIRGILRFSDHYRLPIVLVGNLARMRRVKAESHTYEQISDRISKEVALPDPSRDDFLAFATAFDVEGAEAWETLVEIGLRTTIRHVMHVLETARLDRTMGSLKANHLRAAEAFITGGKLPPRS